MYEVPIDFEKALALQALKGRPEYNDDQPRGEDGQWTSAGGAGDMRGDTYDRAKLIGLVRERLPKARAQFLRPLGKHGSAELKVQSDHIKFDVTLKSTGEIEPSGLLASDDAEGRRQASSALRLIRQLAVDSGSSRILIHAGDEFGGYIWPRLGFELDSDTQIDNVRSAVSERIKWAGRENWVSTERVSEVRSILEAGGKDMAARIARLNDPVSGELLPFWRGDRFRAKPTLGKLLLMGTRARYSLPRAKFDRLSFEKGYPEYDDDQARGDDGRWTAGGGDFKGLDNKWPNKGTDDANEHVNDLRKTVDFMYQVEQKGTQPGRNTLLKKHARSYRFDKNSFQGDKTTQHKCYMCAGRKAINNSDLTYVEGYVSVYGVPIAHAWVVDKDGYVIDPTLRPDSAKSVKAYLGVPFKTDYVVATGLRTKVWGLISHTNRSLFTADPSEFLAKPLKVKKDWLDDEDERRRKPRIRAGRIAITPAANIDTTGLGKRFVKPGPDGVIIMET